MNSTLKKITRILFSLIFWVAVWTIFSYKVGNSFLLPSPKDTLFALSKLIVEGEFWLISLRSFGRIILGIVIAVFLGIVIAVLTSKSKLADSLLTPALSAIKATPVASFIILVSIWFSRNELPVFITALIVLPIVATNISGGIRSVSRVLGEVAKVYRLPLSKKIIKLYIPSIMPYFLAAMKASLGMAWKAGIAAEVLCMPTFAIGTELYFSKTYMEMPEMFAWTFVVIILSLVIEKILISSITRISDKLHASAWEVKA